MNVIKKSAHLRRFWSVSLGIPIQLRTLYKKYVSARYRALSPRSRWLTTLFCGALFIGLMVGLYSVLYNPLTPSERMAKHHANLLHHLSYDLERMEDNLRSEAAYGQRIDSFLAITTSLSDRCYSFITTRPPKDTKSFPKALLDLTRPTTDMCHDVLDVTGYSMEIFDAVDVYVGTPVVVTWVLPSASPKEARRHTEDLHDSAETALMNIKQVIDKERELRYAGAPEIRTVIQDNLASLQQIDRSMQQNDLGRADTLWKPTLLTLYKNQHDILNQRITYWRDFVRLNDLRPAVEKLQNNYCSFVPRDAKQPVCPQS